VTKIPHNRPSLGVREANAASRVIESGWVANGHETMAFEAELAAFVGLDPANVLVTTSGSAALFLCFRTSSRQVNQVVIPTYGCSAPADAAVLAGFNIDYLDSSPTSVIPTWDTDYSDTSIRVLIDLFGIPSTIPPSRRCVTVADAAQSFGAVAAGIPTPLRGDIGIVSFSPTKIMTVGGYGGAIFSTNTDSIVAARDFRDWDGRTDALRRFNLTPGDTSSAIGRVQLARMPELIEKRQSVLASYLTEGIPILKPNTDYIGSGYRAIVEQPNAEVRVQELQKLGVQAILPYSSSEMIGRGLKESPNALAWSERLLSLPIFPDMTKRETGQVINAWHATSKLTDR
jgi:perosamine synthetase